jgi:hypothetical protein
VPRLHGAVVGCLEPRRPIRRGDDRRREWSKENPASETDCSHLEAAQEPQKYTLGVAAKLLLRPWWWRQGWKWLCYLLRPSPLPLSLGPPPELGQLAQALWRTGRTTEEQ